MPNRRISNLAASLIAVTLALASQGARACASCNCSLSSDWESQGLSAAPGLKIDLRYDVLNQDELRHNRSRISSSEAAGLLNSAGDPYEVERYTRNRYFTATFDYTLDSDWGFALQLPFIDRRHETLGMGGDGAAARDGAYVSDTSGPGDARILVRYQGFTARKNFGLLFGLKLPTGAYKKMGTATDPAMPGEAIAIDRGLQEGSGTTDVILGAYTFDRLGYDWEYFAQATLQSALNERDAYRPGDSLSINTGVRYTAMDRLTPQLQINLRHALHDRGDNADTVSTGGTTAYVSPGASRQIDRALSLYGFVQIPVYQDLRGIQLAPRFTVALGMRYAF